MGYKTVGVEVSQVSLLLKGEGGGGGSEKVLAMLSRG